MFNRSTILSLPEASYLLNEPTYLDAVLFERLRDRDGSWLQYMKVCYRVEGFENIFNFTCCAQSIFKENAM